MRQKPEAETGGGNRRQKPEPETGVAVKTGTAEKRRRNLTAATTGRHQREEPKAAGQVQKAEN